MKVTTLKIGILMLWLVVTGNAWAAEVAEISGLNAPFQLGKIAPFRVGDVSASKDLCIYSSTGTYQVTVRGINGSGENFTAVSSNGKPIDYQVFWNNAQGTTGNFQLLTGQISPKLTQLGASNCTTATGQAGYWANLQVVIPDGQLQGARAGFYAPGLQIDVMAVAS